LQRVAGLVSGALLDLRPHVIRDLVQDRLHQPYRSPLVPPLSFLISSEFQVDGLLGVFLSGSGPCVAAMAVENLDEIGRRMCDEFSKCGVECRYCVLSIVKSGGMVMNVNESATK
jgi:homoserine kinase